MAKGIKTPQGEEQNERYTLFTRRSLIKKLEKIAAMTLLKTGEKVSRTDLVNKAIDEFIERWEKKNGAIEWQN